MYYTYMYMYMYTVHEMCIFYRALHKSIVCVCVSLTGLTSSRGALPDPDSLWQHIQHAVMKHVKTCIYSVHACHVHCIISALMQIA